MHKESIIAPSRLLQLTRPKRGVLFCEFFLPCLF
jgi:hypothetical protein